MAGLVTALSVLASMASAYWAYRAVPRRRRIVVTTYAPCRLRPGESTRASSSRTTRQKSQPRYLTQVVIANQCPYDLTSGDFDQGRPLRIDFGAEFAEAPDVWSSAPGTEPPTWRVEGSAVLVGPDLVRPKSRVMVAARTVGLPDVSTSTPLIAFSVVNIRKEPPSREHAVLDLRMTTMVGLVLAALTVLAVVFALGITVSQQNHW